MGKGKCVDAGDNGEEEKAGEDMLYSHYKESKVHKIF